MSISQKRLRLHNPETMKIEPQINAEARRSAFFCVYLRLTFSVGEIFVQQTNPSVSPSSLIDGSALPMDVQNISLSMITAALTPWSSLARACLTSVKGSQWRSAYQMI